MDRDRRAAGPRCWGSSYPGEVSWSLACAEGDGGAITGGAPYSALHIVPLGACTLTMYDSYGDGWNGADWSAPGFGVQGLSLSSGSVGTASVDVVPSIAPEPPQPPATPPPPPMGTFEITEAVDCEGAGCFSYTQEECQALPNYWSSYTETTKPPGCYSKGGYYVPRHNH